MLRNRNQINFIVSVVIIGALLIAGCAAKVPSVVNKPDVAGTPTATLAPAVVEATLPATPTPVATPGLVVYGVVRDQAGEGMGSVEIYRRYASYEPVLIATTDANGYYQSSFYFIPGDEMVAILATKVGMEFEPEFHSWRHYYGYEITRRDFTKR